MKGTSSNLKEVFVLKIVKLVKKGRLLSTGGYVQVEGASSGKEKICL